MAARVTTKDGDEVRRTRARRDRSRTARGRHAGGVAGRGDHGFSVVELVMTITLVSIAVVPLMDATITSIHASSVSREAAEVETVLANAADRVNRAPALCDYRIYVEAAALSKGWPANHAQASYQYYVPGASARAEDPGTWMPGACPGNARTPRLIQLVTITVTSDSGEIARTVKVVKSDV